MLISWTNAANTAAAPAPDKAVVEAEVKKTMDDFAAALNKGDVAALDKLYTDEYTLVDQDEPCRLRLQDSSHQIGQDQI